MTKKQHLATRLPKGLAAAVADVTGIPVGNFNAKTKGASARELIVAVLFYDFGWRLSQIMDVIYPDADPVQAKLPITSHLATFNPEDQSRQKVRQILDLP